MGLWPKFSISRFAPIFSSTPGPVRLSLLGLEFLNTTRGKCDFGPPWPMGMERGALELHELIQYHMKQEKEEEGLISILITIKLTNKARLFNKRNDTLDGMATTHFDSNLYIYSTYVHVHKLEASQSNLLFSSFKDTIPGDKHKQIKIIKQNKFKQFKLTLQMLSEIKCDTKLKVFNSIPKK
uniref:Uncharacterized protein n=1 Tax=Solanum tuberosum TaxID=4113 RepID=M1AB20_SOLTU